MKLESILAGLSYIVLMGVFSFLSADSTFQTLIYCAPHVIAATMVVILIWRRERDIASADSIVRKTVPYAIVGVAMFLAAPVIAPTGTFSNNPAMLNAVTGVFIAAALLPVTAVVLDLWSHIIARCLRRWR